MMQLEIYQSDFVSKLLQFECLINRYHGNHVYSVHADKS